MRHFYEATDDYRAKITDENDATIYLSQQAYDTEAEAIDAAIEWAEDNDLDVELR